MDVTCSLVNGARPLHTVPSECPSVARTGMRSLSLSLSLAPSKVCATNSQMIERNDRLLFSFLIA